jgi:hypothetical protein
MKNKKAATRASLEIFSANLMLLMTAKGVDEKMMAKDLHVALTRVRSWTGAKSFPQYNWMVHICNYFRYYDIYKIITEPITDYKSPE